MKADHNSTAGKSTIINPSLDPHQRGHSRDHLPDGASKMPRFQLAKLQAPGRFALIHKDQLHIDHTYQREKIHVDRINKFASRWSWVMCGALSVAVRDGSYFVMDGQHRKLAADKRPDITNIPCMVFDIESQKAEAGAFVDLNSQKTAVAGIDRFRAMIVAGDPTALGLREMLQSTGHKVASSTSSKGVACVLCLWKLFKRNATLLRIIWPLLADICASSPVVDVLVRAVWGCELQARAQDLSLAESPYRALLITTGGEGLAQEIRRKITVFGRGGEHMEAIALIQWLNKHRLGTKYKLLQPD